jgi:hypothetical protein
MRKFLAKHAAATTGTVSCFDRVLFKGHLPLGYPHAMEEFLHHHGVLFKQLKGFVLQQAERLRTHSHAVAERGGRPWQYFESPVRKDERARAIAIRDGITEGLVCVFATVEPCRSFRLAYGRGRPAIRPAWRKCLFLYFYFLDPHFGLLHVRLQTWCPFTIQVYVNGHEWLARQLDHRGLRYRKLENAFLWLEDPGRAQRLADRFATLKWPAILDTLARRANPLLRDVLANYRYDWAIHQAEYATDVLFTSRGALCDLYPRLLRHATLCLHAQDVLTFLGRKLRGGFAGDLLTEWKRRWPGARVKHWMTTNWIKMYDKIRGICGFGHRFAWQGGGRLGSGGLRRNRRPMDQAGRTGVRWAWSPRPIPTEEVSHASRDLGPGGEPVRLALGDASGRRGLGVARRRQGLSLSRLMLRLLSSK